MVMRILIIIAIITVLWPCAAQEEEQAPIFDLPGASPGPVVFPGPMEKASDAIAQALCPACSDEENAWRANALAFLNNSSNLTVF